MVYRPGGVPTDPGRVPHARKGRGDALTNSVYVKSLEKSMILLNLDTLDTLDTVKNEQYQEDQEDQEDQRVSRGSIYI